MPLDSAGSVVFVGRHGIEEGRVDVFRQAYAKGAGSIESEEPETVAFPARLDED